MKNLKTYLSVLVVSAGIVGAFAFSPAKTEQEPENGDKVQFYVNPLDGSRTDDVYNPAIPCKEESLVLCSQEYVYDGTDWTPTGDHILTGSRN